MDTVHPHPSKFQVMKDTVHAYTRLGSQVFRPQPKSVISSIDNRLLLLVWEFAPAIAGGVYRPAALARYASQSGWAVTVVASAAPVTPGAAGRALLDYVGSAVQIERLQNSNLVPSVRLFPQIDGGLLTALEMASLVQRRFGADIPRTIVASGPPFSSFVAGYFLSRPEVRVETKESVNLAERIHELEAAVSKYDQRLWLYMRISIAGWLAFAFFAALPTASGRAIAMPRPSLARCSPRSVSASCMAAVAPD